MPNKPAENFNIVSINRDEKQNVLSFIAKIEDNITGKVFQDTYTYDKKKDSFVLTHIEGVRAHDRSENGFNDLSIKITKKHTSVVSKEAALDELGFYISSQPNVKRIAFTDRDSSRIFENKISDDKKLSSYKDLRFGQQKEVLAMIGLLTSKEAEFIKNIEKLEAKNILLADVSKEALSFLAKSGNQITHTSDRKELYTNLERYIPLEPVVAAKGK